VLAMWAKHLAHDGEPFGFLDLGVGADIWDGLAELLPECEQGKEQRFGETAEREPGRVDRRVEGRDRPGFTAQRSAPAVEWPADSPEPTRGVEACAQGRRVACS
jgi:hypothetical protein